MQLCYPVQNSRFDLAKIATLSVLGLSVYTIREPNMRSLSRYAIDSTR